MGTETLLPGAELPVHRHLQCDEVLFVHKGQGRATLEAQAMTVVPGTVLYAPRQAWHGLRNTGTGVLQLTWVSAPAGLEGFFRELSRSGAAADAATLRDIAQRHGIEFRPGGEPAAPQAPGPRPRRHRRGGRGRQRGAARQGQPSAGPPPQPAVAAPSAPSPPPQPDQPGLGRRRRRHRRGRHGAPPSPPQPSGAPSASPPAKGGPPQAQARPAPRGKRRSRFGRVKEVYMGGKWIRVVGEGPIISTGRESAEQDT